MSHDDSKYKKLLESTKAIPWNMNWETKAFTYIGPQIEQLLGWPQDSWASAQDWIDRIHPDYRESIANYCIAQSEDGVDHEADYPALTADGSYIWIREVVHIIRKDNVTTELVGFMFDISARKKLEDDLIHANKQLEIYSYLDELTGLANRRLYEQTLETEWARARRNQKPVSMIVLDIDHFKQYNDHYGHTEGDECLKLISSVIQSVTSRSSDLCVRYGGEEFVILLPETGRKNALELGERLRNNICELNIPHANSESGDIVTASIGISTMIPTANNTGASLFESADRMLYQAKNNNRNCVEYC